MVLKAYYPPASIVARNAVSSDLQLFAGDKNILSLIGPSAADSGVPAGILNTGDSGADMNAVAAGGYIYLAPAGRKVTFASGGIADFCVWKALDSANALTQCPCEKPFLLAMGDINRHVTYDVNDMAGGFGYLLCCAANIIEPFTDSPPPAANAFAQTTQLPPAQTACYPQEPRVWSVANRDCPAGQTGTVTYIQFYTCPDQTPGPANIIGNSCLPADYDCVLPKDEIQELNCAWGVQGRILQKRKWRCQGAPSAAAPDPWETILNTCENTCCGYGSCMCTPCSGRFRYFGNWFCSGNLGAD
ncbi:MAG: hypothetical protein PHP45_03620 [Elusimicrobiales bacterium]|nr:hypothetical protein [Elusimicrobiales bacterium]